MVYLKSVIAVVLTMFATLTFAQADVIEKLRQGGYTIFFRHSVTPGQDPNKFNPPGENMFVCSTQRQLNDEGRIQAKHIGDKFKEFNIPVDKVYASVFCRCDDTAKLAFGKSTPVTWMVVSYTMTSMPELRRHLLTQTALGTNNVYVGHAHSLSDQLIGKDFPKVYLKEGEAVVFDPKTATIVGKINPANW